MEERMNLLLLYMYVCVCTVYMANSFNCITTCNSTYITCTMKTLSLETHLLIL